MGEIETLRSVIHLLESGGVSFDPLGPPLRITVPSPVDGEPVDLSISADQRDAIERALEGSSRG